MAGLILFWLILSTMSVSYIIFKFRSRTTDGVKGNKSTLDSERIYVESYLNQTMHNNQNFHHFS